MITAEADQPLTPREQEVLDLVAEGLTSPQIAARLSITHGSVRNHLRSIFVKLNVHTRVAAARIVWGQIELIPNA